ncbi:MAG: S-layer homology domain-containing protein [Candidatus Ancillula sp.]|jgi:hypothetical protein|nr:S-layer homology domain-containing protein [Candidatus Ancillula sp.]
MEKKISKVLIIFLSLGCVLSLFSLTNLKIARAEAGSGDGNRIELPQLENVHVDSYAKDVTTISWDRYSQADKIAWMYLVVDPAEGAYCPDPKFQSFSATTTSAEIKNYTGKYGKFYECYGTVNIMVYPLFPSSPDDPRYIAPETLQFNLGKHFSDAYDYSKDKEIDGPKAGSPLFSKYAFVAGDYTGMRIPTYKESQKYCEKIYLNLDSNGKCIVGYHKVGGIVPFKDIAGNQAQSEISTLYKNSITIGKDSQVYDPNGYVTRAQTAIFLHRFAGSSDPDNYNSLRGGDSAKEKFDDIQGNIAKDDINWLSGTGITKGLTKKSFGTENKLTRAQLIMFLYRFEGSPEVDLNNSRIDMPSDIQGMDKSFQKAITWAYQKGVAKGDNGKFYANNKVTRAQIALFLVRFMNEVQKPALECFGNPGVSYSDSCQSNYGSLPFMRFETQAQVPSWISKK